jgi:integrase/recombinase XerD
VSDLRRAAGDYLAMRRSLGYKLERQGPVLMDFISYLEDAGASTVTVEAALAWAVRPAGSRSWHQHRLSTARGFAAYLKTADPACQVPPKQLLAGHSDRVAPYLYSPDEITALVQAAGSLGRPLQAATYQALISLLTVTGLRAGEAIRLARADVSLDDALITIVNTKFGKSRLVPLHPDTAGMLRRYAARRDELCPAPATDAFFLSSTGSPLLISSIDATFARLLGMAGITVPAGHARPKVHDLRHSMAVNTLVEWYRSGADVAARMPSLSTWLGHGDPASTFWYLHASPELLALAAGMLQDSAVNEEDRP